MFSLKNQEPNHPPSALGDVEGEGVLEGVQGRRRLGEHPAQHHAAPRAADVKVRAGRCMLADAVRDAVNGHLGGSCREGEGGGGGGDEKQLS